MQRSLGRALVFSVRTQIGLPENMNRIIYAEILHSSKRMLRTGGLVGTLVLYWSGVLRVDTSLKTIHGLSKAFQRN